MHSTIFGQIHHIICNVQWWRDDDLLASFFGLLELPFSKAILMSITRLKKLSHLIYIYCFLISFTIVTQMEVHFNCEQKQTLRQKLSKVQKITGNKQKGENSTPGSRWGRTGRCGRRPRQKKQGKSRFQQRTTREEAGCLLLRNCE